MFGSRQGVAALVFVGLFVLELATLFYLRYFRTAGTVGTYSNAKIQSTGAIQSLSEVLFTKYLLPFEVVSVLLLVAIIGAVVLTRKTKNEPGKAEKGGEES